MISNLWNAIREQLTPSRVVPVTGHLLAAGIGLLSSYLATKGWLSLDPAETLAVVAPIVTGIEGTILHWQKGNREYEARGANRVAEIENFDVHPDDAVPDVDDLDSEKAKAAEEKALKDEGRHPKGGRR